ncbi:NAD(P)H-dependent oxidoreductase [Parabacteroides sp. FAFU027]|uniref:NAD(P)H-dependent oxidoreductase n=1 Tax=Parabacteroides sp. FAFU027 TaxID=2922715 RepID=UPI001FB04952|nr:NAD(P)H-dependent oxidoreductase [Parabacteroides sp. FAFU027]
MNLIEALKWRYATKRMNGQPVEAEKVETILESIRLTPTSLGLQPFKVVVVSDKTLREKIHEKACQQPQIVEGSHVLVFAVRTDVKQEEVDEYIHRVATERDIPVENLAGYKSMISNVQELPRERYLQWTARQAYIALGISITAAAFEKVDATPIEGFVPELLDEILGLGEMGLHSVVLLALGNRDEAKDHLAKAKKVRKSAKAMFIFR